MLFILPAPMIWLLAVLDIAATLWVWRHPTRWPALAAGLAVSAYLTVVGAFSIGPIYLLLFVAQLVRLAQIVAERRRSPR